MSVSFVMTNVGTQSQSFNAEAQRTQSKHYRGRKKCSFSFSANLCASALNAIRIFLRIHRTSR